MKEQSFIFIVRSEPECSTMTIISFPNKQYVPNCAPLQHIVCYNCFINPLQIGSEKNDSTVRGQVYL